MDIEPEEIQFLGLYSIYKKAFNTIVSWRNLYSQITLALIIPLAFIFLAQIKISELLFLKILLNQEPFYHDIFQSSTSIFYTILVRIVFEFTALLLLIKAIYFLFAFILILLLTSLVVYIILYIYTLKQVTFRKAISIVAKVCERLMITFLWNFLTMLGYNVITLLIGILCSILMEQTTFMVILIILSVFYLIGFAFLNVIWHLASIISVLEDVCGIQAMIKSKALIKGKMLITSVIFFKLHVSFLAIQIAFQKLAILEQIESVSNVNILVCYGIVGMSFLTMLCLYILIIRTTVYFVCKSFHHENINNDQCIHPEVVHIGRYFLLKARNAQLQQFYV